MAQGRHAQPDRCRSRTGAVAHGRGPRGRVRRAGPGLCLDRQPGRRDGGRGRRGRAARPTCSSRPTSSRPRSTTRWPTARRSCPIDGTYDDVNRLCLEVADETGWGFVNINLRPFYAEGSKTLAYEIAESLGWRSPDVVVAPGRQRGDVHARRARLRGARRARAHRAPADPLRRRPGGRLRPGRDGVRDRRRRHRARPRAGHVRPLAGHRQPGRRSLRRRAGARQRRLDRGHRGRRHGGRASATSPGSRASTRRRPVA